MVLFLVLQTLSAEFLWLPIVACTQLMSHGDRFPLNAKLMEHNDSLAVLKTRQFMVHMQGSVSC